MVRSPKELEASSTPSLCNARHPHTRKSLSFRRPREPMGVAGSAPKVHTSTPVLRDKLSLHLQRTILWASWAMLGKVDPGQLIVPVFWGTESSWDTFWELVFCMDGRRPRRPWIRLLVALTAPSLIIIYMTIVSL